MATTKIADLSVRASLDGTEEIPTVKTGDTTGKTVTVQQVADYAALGTASFLGLSDTPDSYTSQALKVVRVNAGATALEFSTAAAGDMTLAGVQSVTGLKTFDKDKIAMKGTSTGVNTISVANTSATSYTNTIPAKNGTFAMTDDITGTNSGTNTGDQSGGDATNNIGYLNIPQNSQSAAYTTVLGDSGKHILHPSSDNNARTFTIDSNANVAYPIGTAITFINMINTVTIAITSDTMTLMGAGTTGSRTLAAKGMATAIKIASTGWVISGNGLT